MGNENAKDAEMIELLTQGMDTVMLNVSYKGTSFQIPACRKNPNENYRVSHRTLLYFYQKIRRQFNDVKVVLKPEWAKMDIGYCIAACTVQTREGESDLYIGENRLNAFSSSVNSDNPFQIAVNRAMDKAIFYEIFGLPSRFFDNDGRPVLSSDIDNFQEPDSNSLPEQKALAEGNDAGKGSQDSSSGKEKPQQAARGEDLEHEYAELSKYTIPTRQSDGTTGNTPLGDMKEKVLVFFSNSLQDATKDIDKERKLKIDRFLELKKLLSKKATA